jgi:hypothetical protein
MVTHYCMESLNKLFLSDQYISDKNNYLLQQTPKLNKLKKDLDSIEINKQYYRTGISIKNPKYKKKLSDDTYLLKDFKTSLNKLSSLNYKTICDSLIVKFKAKKHLYPLVIETIFEYALIHHNYNKYYCYLLSLFHDNFKDISIINKQIDIVYSNLQVQESNNNSEYAKLCSNNKLTDKLIGYCMFLYELDISNIIKDRIEPLIDTLINRIRTNLSEDESYKCIMCLHTICKKMYGKDPIPDKYLSDIEELKKTKYMKVKFKLMDIIERS